MLGGSDFEIYSPSEVTGDLEYDIDESATNLLENVINRGNHNSDSYLPLEYYYSLTPKERDSWRKLPLNMKSIILKGRNSNNRPNNRSNSNKSNNLSYKNIKPPSFNAKPFTKANLHEL